MATGFPVRMSWWYPKKSRADELTARLNALERGFSEGLDAGPDRLLHLSDRLAQALDRSDFPNAQVGRWLWVASQYRLYASSRADIAALAAAALVFLEEALTRAELDDDHRRELNWILETSVGRLAPLVGPAHLKNCLSSEELALIDEQLSRHDDSAPFDVAEMIFAASSQIQMIERFGGLGDWVSLAAKAESIIVAAAKPGLENAPARAALRYLAEVHDVVEDDVGMLGLLDDVYVLEWAYAAVESQTLCLPILDAMSRRHPFVGTLGLGARGAQLDRFGCYVVCAGLETLSSSKTGALVLRDVGPYPIVSAVAAAVEAANVQAGAFDEELQLWPDNCAITIGDGTTVFHARWGGRLHGTARPRFRLHVADKGVISVGEEVLPYLARAQRDWKRLANGTHVSTWLKDRNIDPLVGLTGRARRRPAHHEAVLLLTARAKLDRFLTAMLLQGTTPAALLGARWIDTQGRSHDLPGSATDRPLLYSCGDVGTASDLISDPPEHIEGWRIIVDGAQSARALHAALASSGRLDSTNLCIFAELHERENVSDLVAHGVDDVWYLEDQDVEVPPIVHPGKSDETDALARFFARRSAHWTASYTTRVGEDPFLNAVAECLRKGNARRDGDPALDALDLTVSAFLRRATAHPLPTDDDRLVLKELATAIVGQASTLAIYEAHAAEIRSLFAGYGSTNSSYNRGTALLDLVSTFGTGEAVAVVCRSHATAESCRTVAAETKELESLEWMTIDGLRSAAPFDRVVVPGWLGRRTMRELSNVGFGARTDMLFLRFERQWYEKTMSAARRWERRLERSTAQRLKRVVDDGFGDGEPRWLEQAARRVQVEVANDVEPIEDSPETARAEQRAIEGIRKVLPSAALRSEMASAQLVLLHEPGSFALLPPAGQIIVLPEGGVGGDGDRRLLFPVSSLAPGMLIALPLESDRDLIDAWADRMLEDGGALRRRADRWKAALKQHFALSGESYADFALRLNAAGERRDVLTIRSWANDTRSVAPRNYRRMVPLIGQLVGASELSGQVDDTIIAIEGVYHARADAAEAIVHEIFSGSIDLRQPTISLDVDGRRIAYALTRVERLAGVQQVPSELVGRRLHLSELHAHDGAVA